MINVASFVAILGAATSQISYTASKGAVLAMSRELGVQFARQGVRVNALCPGPVETPLLLAIFGDDPAAFERRRIHWPMGRLGEAARDRQCRALPRERRVVVRERRRVPRRRRADRGVRHAGVGRPRQSLGPGSALRRVQGAAASAPMPDAERSMRRREVGCRLGRHATPEPVRTPLRRESARLPARRESIVCSAVSPRPVVTAVDERWDARSSAITSPPATGRSTPSTARDHGRLAAVDSAAVADRGLRSTSGAVARRAGAEPRRGSDADDLDEPAPVALAVELEEQHPLPRAEAELAVAHRDRLAGRAEQHRHAVRVAVAELHVLLADVLGAAIPVVVRVVVLGRHESLAASPRSPRGTRARTRSPAPSRSCAASTRSRSRRGPRSRGRPRDLLRDVGDRETAGCAELHLALERLHGSDILSVAGRGTRTRLAEGDAAVPSTASGP